MKIQSKPIDEASPNELRDYAQTFLNLEIENDATPESIFQKIMVAQPGITAIFIQESEENLQNPEEAPANETAPPTADSGRGKGTLGRGDPRAIILIPMVDSADGLGSKDVAVGVNGVIWQLKRGMKLDVPWRVVDALQNAIQDVVSHSQEEGKEGEVIISTSMRFAIQYPEGAPPADEIAEWHERTKDQFCP